MKIVRILLEVSGAATIGFAAFIAFLYFYAVKPGNKYCEEHAYPDVER